MIRHLSLHSFFAFVFALTGTTAAQQLNSGNEHTLNKSDPPYRLADDVVVHADLVYGSPNDRDLHLDLFESPGDGSPLPAVLFIQGSGYNGNNKTHFWRQAVHLAAMGFIAVCIEHRGLHPDGAHWPSQLEDAQAALRWISANADKYRIDPGRIGVIGASSGAHLAALLGLMDRTKSDSLPAVQAIVLINGVVDLVFFAENHVWSEDYQMRVDFSRLLDAEYYVDPGRWHAASPLTYVSSGDPPVLIMHGSADRTLPIEQAKRLYDALRRVGAPAEFVEIEGGGHEMMNAFAYYETLARMEQFLIRILREEP